jgi:hypothetical protein
MNLIIDPEQAASFLSLAAAMACFLAAGWLMHSADRRH